MYSGEILRKSSFNKIRFFVQALIIGRQQQAGKKNSRKLRSHKLDMFWMHCKTMPGNQLQPLKELSSLFSEFITNVQI